MRSCLKSTGPFDVNLIAIAIAAKTGERASKCRGAAGDVHHPLHEQRQLLRLIPVKQIRVERWIRLIVIRVLLVGIVGEGVQRDVHEVEFFGRQLGREAALNFVAQRFVGAGFHGVAQFGEDNSENGVIFVPTGDIGVAAGFVGRLGDPAQNVVSRSRGEGRTGVHQNQCEFIARTLGALALKAEHSEEQLFGQDVTRKVEWVRSGARHDAGGGARRGFPVWPRGRQASSFRFKLHGDIHRWFGFNFFRVAPTWAWIRCRV